MSRYTLSTPRSQETLDGDSCSESHSRNGSRHSGCEKIPVQEGSSVSSVPASPAAVIASIAFYASVSLSIVYFNWWLFTSAFQFPVFVSWIQQVFGLILFIFLGLLGQKVAIFRHFPLTFPKWETAKHVLPLTLSFIGMVGLANICLKFVQVSTYQVARSLTIFFTMALSYLILHESQRPKTMMSCALMVIGFIIGSLDTASLSLVGVIAGGFSSAFQALYNIAIKKTLHHVDNDPNLLLYYNLWISLFLFIPVIFISGEGSVFSTIQLDPRQSMFFSQWGSLLLSGVLATAMNLSAYWCVKVTSPLTFNIVGFTKSIVQSLGGIVFLGDLVSLQSLLGIILSVGGSGWYSWLKVSESGALRKQTPIGYEQLERKNSSFDLEKAVEEELALVDLPKRRGPVDTASVLVSCSSDSEYSSDELTSAVDITRRIGTPPNSGSMDLPSLVGRQYERHHHGTLDSGTPVQPGKCSTTSTASFTVPSSPTPALILDGWMVNGIVADDTHVMDFENIQQTIKVD